MMPPAKQRSVPLTGPAGDEALVCHFVPIHKSVIEIKLKTFPPLHGNLLSIWVKMSRVVHTALEDFLVNSKGAVVKEWWVPAERKGLSF